jgi:uncharacterized membrane protein YdfJ with MMPL/SSD domain
MLAFVVWWEELAGAVTGRRSWLLGLGLVVLGIGFMVLIGGDAATGQAPLTVPAGSGSARVQALARQFPGGDRVPLILVVSRADGAVLDSADVAAARAALDRMQALTHPFGAISSAPPMVSADGKAAIGAVPIRADLSGLVLGDGVAALRTAADTGAGIVLAAVFCVLGVLPLIVLTQLGIIVGLGILLDTFIVRTLVIPALFALIGDRIWWPTTNAKPVEQQADLAQHERSAV